MKYKHIFDFFDENGRYDGGCEPVRDYTHQPKDVKNFGVYHNPRYVIYVGWCTEEDSNHVYSGCYFPDSTNYDHDTKQLTPIYETVQTPIGPQHWAKISSRNYPDMTLEMCCAIKGIDPPESYIKHKKDQERMFQEEYEKVKDDPEYFRTEYYGKIQSRNGNKI